MDSLTKKEQPDRSKINMNQPHEVKYWARTLGVSKEELQKAVYKVGNSAATVRKELSFQIQEKPQEKPDESPGL
jgi:hypothetical protein